MRVDNILQRLHKESSQSLHHTIKNECGRMWSQIEHAGLLFDTVARALACTCVNVEQIIPGHARLARYSSWDDHKVAVVQSLRQLLWPQMACNLLARHIMASLG